jgi:hypothetical protein
MRSMRWRGFLRSSDPGHDGYGYMLVGGSYLSYRHGQNAWQTFVTRSCAVYALAGLFS